MIKVSRLIYVQIRIVQHNLLTFYANINTMTLTEEGQEEEEVLSNLPGVAEVEEGDKKAASTEDEALPKPLVVAESEPVDEGVFSAEEGQEKALCKPPDVAEVEKGDEEVVSKEEGKQVVLSKPPVVAIVEQEGKKVFSAEEGQEKALSKPPDVIAVEQGEGGVVSAPPIVETIERSLPPSGTFVTGTFTKASAQDQTGLAIGINKRGKILITGVLPNSLAAKATDLQAGLHLVSINDTKVEGVSIKEAAKLLMQPEGDVTVVAVAPTTDNKPAAENHSEKKEETEGHECCCFVFYFH